MARLQSSLRDSVSRWCHIPSDKSLGYYRMPLRGKKAPPLLEMCWAMRSTDAKHVPEGGGREFQADPVPLALAVAGQQLRRRRTGRIPYSRPENLGFRPNRLEVASKDVEKGQAVDSLPVG